MRCQALHAHNKPSTRDLGRYLASPPVFALSRCVPGPSQNSRQQLLSAAALRHRHQLCPFVAQLPLQLGRHLTKAAAVPGGGGASDSEEPSAASDAWLRDDPGVMDVPPEQADAMPLSASKPQNSVDSEADVAADSVADRITTVGMAKAAWRVLRPRLLAVVALMLIQDAAIFAVQRLSDYAANHANLAAQEPAFTTETIGHYFPDLSALFLNGFQNTLYFAAAVATLGPAFTPDTIGNMAFGTRNAALDTFQSGYVWLRYLFQATSLPPKLMAQAFGTAALLHLVGTEPETVAGRNPFRHLFVAVRNALSALRAGAAKWQRVFVVSVLVVARFLPLGAASALLVTLPWTLPRIMGLQAAVPAAVAEGLDGRAAVRRSQELLTRHWKALAPVLLLVTAAPRLALAAPRFLLAPMPPRFYTQVPELPLLITLGAPLLAVVLFRLQEILPIVAYRAAVAEEAASGIMQAGDGDSTASASSQEDSNGKDFGGTQPA